MITTRATQDATAVLQAAGAPGVQSISRVTMSTPNGGTIVVAATIYREWVSLSAARTATGRSVQAELGWPLEEFSLPNRTEVAYFERGAIVLRPDGRAFAVYGQIYLHYRDLYDLKTNAGLAIGLPVQEEQAVAGGRFQTFDAGDIYWNASTNTTCEVHGGIRDKWQALGGAGGFLGFPMTDEQPVKKNGVEIGRSEVFTGGTIFWSPGTGAFSVHGAIRDMYVEQYNGPLGTLGFPISDETPSASGAKRFNDFEHGCIVWTASSGALQALTSLDVFVQSINGSGSHTFAESIGLASVWLYAKVHITSNTGINVQSHLPPGGGDYGHPSATPGQIFTVSPMRGELSLWVQLDGWDKCAVQSDVHLGTVSTTLNADNGWGVNNPQHLNDGDFHAVLDMRQKSVDNPNDPNFRKDLFWGFDNPSTPVLTRAQYGQTFSDVESNESSAHWWDDMFYNDFFKTIAAGGNCFGMCLESCFAERNASLFSEPIFPISMATAIDEVNKKQAYQLGAAYLDWFVANFLGLQFWDPINVFNASRAAWNRGDLPLICLTDEGRGEGHCVRPCGPNAYRDLGAQLVIEVANPNAPGTDDANDANQIVIDKATNTYVFHLSTGGSVWKGGHLSGGIMSWVPFSVVCREPRTPFWEALGLALGGGLLLLGAGASTTQITDDAGRTLYKPERVGARSPRWDDLRMDSGRIPGLVRVPQLGAFLSRGPIIGAAALDDLLHVVNQKPIPELYRLVGLPDPYGPAPQQSQFNPIGLLTSALTDGNVAAPALAKAPNGASMAVSTSANATAHAALGIGPPAQLHHQVAGSSAAPYRWGFHTTSAAAVATVTGSGGGSDEFVVERIGGVDQQITLKAPNAGGARTAQLVMRSAIAPRRSMSYAVDNVTVQPGASFAASVLADGRSLQLQNQGADATVTLRLQGDAGPGSAVKTLAIPAGKTAVVTAADMANLASTPMSARIMAAPGGAIESTVTL